MSRRAKTKAKIGRPTEGKSRSDRKEILGLPLEIVAAEVKTWFGPKCRLSRTEFERIARELNNFRPRHPYSSPNFQPPVLPQKEYWDRLSVSEAAKTLIQAIPHMLSHWRGLTPTPNSLLGKQAIEHLEKALVLAKHFIDWPFGAYEPRTSRTTIKPWHPVAVVVARVVVGAMKRGGVSSPGLSRNSVVVRVIKCALRRLEIEGAQMITESAIAMQLKRHHERWFVPKNPKPMTTK